MNLNKEIGERLTLWEKNHTPRLTSKEIAESIGMDSGNYTHIKSGRKGITVERAVVLSTTYNISLNWLLRGIGSMSIEGPDTTIDELLNSENLTLDTIAEVLKMLNKKIDG